MDGSRLDELALAIDGEGAVIVGDREGRAAHVIVRQGFRGGRGRQQREAERDCGEQQI